VKAHGTKGQQRLRTVHARHESSAGFVKPRCCVSKARDVGKVEGEMRVSADVRKVTCDRCLTLMRHDNEEE
jgi:hypothetical protein